MQTFLPFPSFIESAQVLDKRRCWKQVIEAAQIISVLEKLEKQLNITIGWVNHPAVRMWEGYTWLLKEYFNSFLDIAKTKHGINTQYQPFSSMDILGSKGYLDIPFWLGNEDFHRAMRSRLIEKKPEFYGLLWPEDKGFNGGKYLWPDMKTKTFKII